jgi:ribulose 1,5-bisphosphate synthetase/thiazole synthase
MTPVHDIRANEAIRAITFPYEKYLHGTVETDLVIAGGGTAGAPAAMAALERGAKVATVEYFPELGGTKTLGGVMGYYWGYRRSGVFRLIDEGVKDLGTRLGGSSRAAMMLYFRKAATHNGGMLLTNAIISGATREGNRVTGLVVERNGELALVRGKLVIDATGDADVAAFAGAAWEFGDQRMQATQNYSQWDVNPGLRTWQDSSTNRDYDILANHTLSELQRGYELTHHESHYYDFMPMLTVREYRRISGEYTITLKDVVEERRHADTIALAHSDYDPHHFGDTVLTRVGCLLPHGISAVVEIPYRALLPKGLDGLLVSAKAISQTHNALQFTRMSMDIMTLGYVTGCIGAGLCRGKIAPRDFDVGSLRQTLSELNLVGKPVEATEERELLARRIEALESGEENSLIRVLALPREDIEPLLVTRFAQAGSDTARLRLAKALAWFGNPAGNSLILDEMKRLFAEEQATGTLPWEYYRKDQNTHYWTINQDIALLGLSGDRSVLPAILDLADGLKLGNPPVRQETVYNRGRIDLRLIPYFNRIINLCFVIERMPDAGAVRTLSRFLDDPYIANGVTRVPQTAGEKVYAGMLESRIAAALARCGARRGFDVLVGYLNDIHPFLASYAHRELKSMLQEDHGYDERRWKACIDRQTFPRAVAPQRRNAIEW